jgi:hypothetical protein
VEPGVKWAGLEVRDPDPSAVESSSMSEREEWAEPDAAAVEPEIFP